MNNGWKYTFIFLAGALAGALGMAASSKGKPDFKPMAANLISRGIDVKDAFVGKVEALKEDVEDLTAQARLESEKRKAAKEAQDQSRA